MIEQINNLSSALDVLVDEIGAKAIVEDGLGYTFDKKAAKELIRDYVDRYNSGKA